MTGLILRVAALAYLGFIAGVVIWVVLAWT